MTSGALVLSGAALGGALLAPFVRPTLLFALALAGTLVSGNADEVHLPVSPDRVLVVAALAALLVAVAEPGRAASVRRLRTVDWLLVAVAGIGTVSAIASRSLGDEASLFGLLDRLGVVPFAGFLLAERLFGTERDRMVLVRVLIAVGAYLSFTAIAQAAGASNLVFPRYILDEGLGTHADRARGPFLEAAANGLALFECGVAAVIGTRATRTRLARAGCLVVAFACAVGVVATVTRAAWLGAAVGAVVGLAVDPRTRRRLPAMLAAGTATVVLALAVVPGLADRAEDRSVDQRPVWDRLNTNDAAVRAIEEHPLFGVGWGRFVEVNPEYLRQADDRPLTGSRIGVHNVLLSHTVELGLIGGTAWVLAVAAAVAAAWRHGRALDPMWRAGAMAVVANWAIVGAFGPLSYAFPNMCLWLWLGLAAAPGARLAPRAPDFRTPPVPCEPLLTSAPVG